MPACMTDRPDQTRPDRHTQIWPVFIFLSWISDFADPPLLLRPLDLLCFSVRYRRREAAMAAKHLGKLALEPSFLKIVQPYWWRNMRYIMSYPAKCFALLGYNRSRKVGHRWFSAGMRFFSTKRMAESAFFDTATAERHRICCIR